LFIVYINSESLHLIFSDKKFRYEVNFFAPVAHKVNEVLPSFLMIPEIDQKEYVWWYAKDLSLYIKAFLLGLIARISYDIKEQNRYISLMYTVLLFFILKEVVDYILFKNIFNMYWDNVVANFAIIVLSFMYALNEPRGSKK
jgi:hypothetical protein